MWFLGAGKGKGWEGGRERRGPWGFVFLKVLNLLFYSVFYDPVRINYNLPAGYLSSAVTYSVMAEALYPHGRLYLILSPSLLPLPFPHPNPKKIPQKRRRKLSPTPSQNHPKILTLFSLFLSLFPAPEGLSFPFQKKERNPLKPSIFKGLEGEGKEEGGRVCWGDWSLGWDFWRREGEGWEGAGQTHECLFSIML